MSGLGSIEDRQADAFDAARAYLNALDELDGSDGRHQMPAIAQRDEALHDLALAVRGECKFCAPETCPGYLG